VVASTDEGETVNLRGSGKGTAGPPELLASIIIPTYNHRDALMETLKALSRQTVPPDLYGVVVVVDDGSVDGTWEALKDVSLPCAVRASRQPAKRGISAGRNLAILHARGRYSICVSDDLIVPESFIATHVETPEWGSPLVSTNGHLTLREGPILWGKKPAKRFLSRDAVMAVLFRFVAVCERGYMPERTLRRLYRLLIGLGIFRGWRDGLKTLERERAV
jgi:glycosyltransferase involved in cell wall biosynthesis